MPPEYAHTSLDDLKYPGGVFTQPLPAAMHKSCALYTVLVCPFLRYPGSFAKKSWRVHRGGAEVVGFTRWGISFFTDPARWDEASVVFAYWDEIKRHRYATWRDVLPVYAEAVADDARLIDPNTRLRWTDSPADQRSLAQCAAMDRARLAYLRSAFTVVNGYRYRLAQL